MLINEAGIRMLFWAAAPGIVTQGATPNLTTSRGTEVSNCVAVLLMDLQEGMLEGLRTPQIVPFVKFPVDTDTARGFSNQLVRLPPGYLNLGLKGI